MRGPIRVGHAVALCTTLALVHAETTPHPNTAQGVNYIGDQRCRPCHLREFANYRRTGMGRSMSLPGEVPELQGSALPVTVKVDSPGRSYRVYRSGGKIFHEARAIDESARQIFSDTHEVTYAVGSGRTGRSYFVRRGEELFISPLSYYSSERRWDLSPGHETGQFRNFNRPAGELCVSCHSGLRLVEGASNSFRLPAAGSLSIGCERCHGPGQIHAGARDPQTARRSIVNPAKLPDALRDDVCNQCHLAGDARVVRPGKTYADFRPGLALDDIVTIYSVPPGLKPSGMQALSHVSQLHLSRCWTATDGRMGCITCHNPHGEPNTDEAAAYFRQRCLTCHSQRGCSLPLTSRQQTRPSNNCIECHMPRRSLTNIAHSALTDHRIPRMKAAADPMPLAAVPAGAVAAIRERGRLPIRATETPMSFGPWRSHMHNSRRIIDPLRSLGSHFFSARVRFFPTIRRFRPHTAWCFWPPALGSGLWPNRSCKEP